MQNTSACHLTSVHPRFDVRIFFKQCRSLAAAGYDVALVVADGKGDETEDGIQIYDAGVARGRLDRMLRTTRRVYQKALELDADIYHLHDPELIPVGLQLKRRGKKVILDAHEDTPAQILGKPYLTVPVRQCVSRLFRVFERRACAGLDAVVAATPHIRDKFLAIHPRTVDVNNYPLLEELVPEASNPGQKLNQVCYAGGISADRGLWQMLRAMQMVSSQTRLQLAGCFSEPALQQQAQHCPGWQRVDFLGFVDRHLLREVLQSSIAGLVLFQGLPNQVQARPNKMFEYMGAGLAVIASDFPMWRELLASQGLGICVDPTDPRAIAEAVDYLAANPQQAREMGSRGRKIVEEKYNWQLESRKLIQLYQGLLGAGSIA